MMNAKFNTTQSWIYLNNKVILCKQSDIKNVTTSANNTTICSGLERINCNVWNVYVYIFNWMKTKVSTCILHQNRFLACFPRMIFKN